MNILSHERTAGIGAVLEMPITPESVTVCGEENRVTNDGQGVPRAWSVPVCPELIDGVEDQEDN